MEKEETANGSTATLIHATGKRSKRSKRKQSNGKRKALEGSAKARNRNIGESPYCA
jgi:hypothetical protein